jgi:hypothetical protein
MARVVWALMEDDLTLPLFDDETSDPKLWLFSLRNTLSQEKFIEVLFFDKRVLYYLIVIKLTPGLYIVRYTQPHTVDIKNSKRAKLHIKVSNCNLA